MTTITLVPAIIIKPTYSQIIYDDARFISIRLTSNSKQKTVNMSLSKELHQKTHETSSILDLIHEKVCNVEQTNNRYSITVALNDTLKQLSKRERSNRDSTITFINGEKIDHNKITSELENRWCEEQKQPPISFWQDKLHTYCQFITPTNKNSFLDFLMMDNKLVPIKELLAKPNKEGFYFTRRPVKIELNMVRGNIRTDIIKEQLTKILGKESEIMELKESKPHNITKSRSIYFKIQADAFSILFKELDGAIPYTNKATNTRTRLYAKINVKPWQCRDCFAFSNGMHQCQGKICVQCGNKGHDSKDCKAKTKFCPNCKRKGHKAKEPHCQTYLNELAKEIRKLDIPLEFFEDKDLRYMLVKNISIK